MGKARNELHGGWCQVFIGTGGDIRRKRYISEVVMEEGLGGWESPPGSGAVESQINQLRRFFWGALKRREIRSRVPNNLMVSDVLISRLKNQQKPLHQLLPSEVSILHVLGRDIRSLENIRLDGIQQPRIYDNRGKSLI